MAAEISFLQKLWNRGVDVGVGVITSVIVGLIGLAFWRAKLWLDLRAAAEMQHQQHGIAEELEAGKRLQDAKDRYLRLRKEKDIFAAASEAATTVTELAECWSRYEDWLHSNSLNLLPGNLAVINRNPNWAGAMRRYETVTGVMHPQSNAAQQKCIQLIRDTELPPEQ